MAHVITVPDVGEGITEVELVSWSVAVGDTVKRNQILAEVMTDKANVEIPSPADGVIAGLNGEVGAKLAVGSPLVELDLGDGAAPPPSPGGVPGPVAVGTGVTTSADVAAGDAAGVTAPAPALVVAPAPGPSRGGGVVAPPVPAARSMTTTAAGARSSSAAARTGPPRPEGQRPVASPAVRHRAREAGLDLRRVPGTGPAGRITHDDLDAYLRAGPGSGAAVGRPGPDITVAEEPIVGVRRLIAERMVASTTSIPHITYVEEVDVTALEDLRADLNAESAAVGSDDGPARPRLTLLPFLVRALVVTLPAFPRLNAHVDDDRGMITTFGGVHVGIATQTDNGLVVPVIRHAESQGLWTLAATLDDRATAARQGRAAPGELSGSTITITSLGALGGVVTTPVINKPEVAIVGVNKIAIRPVWRDGSFVPRQMMNLSSSFDHRIIDGWVAASFVQALRRCLEQPARLFLDAGTEVAS
ncbi:MAG: dihydrolipoamide acetyltransferase family protein [Acidimicrobiales bacterium]